MVVDATRPILVGVALGILAALAIVPALRSVLFGVDPLAPGPFAIVTATMLAVGVGAPLIAALPMRHINPVDALKAE
jgi:hypothetical protein